MYISAINYLQPAHLTIALTNPQCTEVESICNMSRKNPVDSNGNGDDDDDDDSNDDIDDDEEEAAVLQCSDRGFLPPMKDGYCPLFTEHHHRRSRHSVN